MDCLCVRRRLCILQILHRHNDLGVRPIASDLLISLTHESFAGATICLNRNRMWLADVATSA